MANEKIVTVTVRMSEELREAAKQKAAQTGEPLSVRIRDMLRQWLAGEIDAAPAPVSKKDS